MLDTTPLPNISSSSSSTLNNAHLLFLLLLFAICPIHCLLNPSALCLWCGDSDVDRSGAISRPDLFIIVVVVVVVVFSFFVTFGDDE